MIPKTLHYVWVGGALPAFQRECVDTWRRTNPDYEVRRWNESNIDFSLPMLRRAYDAKQWAKIADLVRLLVVARHGGIYLDTDFKLFKSLDPVLLHTCFYGFQEQRASSDWVANGVFGAEPGHWFVELAVQRFLGLKEGWLERPTAYGPKLITRMLVQQGLRAYAASGTQVKDIFIYPVPVFFPFHWTEEFTEACVRPETLAAHFWEQSWKKDVSRVYRAASFAKSMLRRRST